MTRGDGLAPPFRIELRRERPERSLVERARAFPTALLSDAMQKLNTMDWRLKPVWNCPADVAGPALTVRVRPGDNTMCIKAISVAAPGDIIVVQAHGDVTHSVWGGVMAELAVKRGVAGLVVDGLVRDTADLERTGFPVWALGATPLAPNRNVPPGQIGTRIVCGNTVIETGDLVRADRDGVVVIPKASIPMVLAAAQERQGEEERWVREILEGEDPLLPAAEGLLAEAGVTVVEVD